jgi:hypothetical protein
MERSVSIQELQTKTDELLSWVEEKKMQGFIKSEIDHFRSILEECLKKETYGEMIEFMTEQIRKWIRDLWNPSVIGKMYERYHNHTPRAKVLQHFPVILREYLETLSNIDQYELLDEEREIFTQIELRFKVGMMMLELKESEKPEPPEERKKSRRRKPPRANK